MRTAVSVAVALALSTLPSRADWQYTHWGMSREEVKAAAGGEVVQNDDLEMGKPERVPFYTLYKAGSVPFRAYFVFDGLGGGLSGVKLKASPQTECSMLRVHLENVYGKPAHSADAILETHVRRWNDAKSGNSVLFWEQQARCTISYWKMAQPGEQGGL